MAVNAISLDALLLSMAIWHILVFSIVILHPEHVLTFFANITLMRHKQEQQLTPSAYIVPYMELNTSHALFCLVLMALWARELYPLSLNNWCAKAQ